jgi:phenylacetate-CoA ligase
MDLYGPLLAKALFPTFESLRGRPTVPLLRYLLGTERWSLEALRELQGGLLRRLVRHAYVHTAHYRDVLDQRGLHPEDFTSVDDLGRLPLLDRDTLTATFETRTATAPPSAVIRKSTSGTTGQPVVVKYNAESRYWRDAIRWRGYGWAGHTIGKRAMHYWGFGPDSPSWFTRTKLSLDHWLKRDFYVDCTPRNEPALATAAAELQRFAPHEMVANSSGAAALAQYIDANNLRRWDAFPVIVGAERLWPHEREVIQRVFGPAFETYGCREVMMIAAECEHHAGMHTSMEAMVTEIVVREPDGSVRRAYPGETGEVVVTDLHNLACPMIRYVTGDLAVEHGDAPCACGRSLARIGPIEGRVTETLRDGRGNAVGGLVFNVLFGTMDHVARRFQVVQRKDSSVVMKVVPMNGRRLPDREEHKIRAFADKYLPDIAFSIQIVEDIPLTPAGKRRVVVVEKPT